jgi:hypothetical protein
MTAGERHRQGSKRYEKEACVEASRRHVEALPILRLPPGVGFFG